MKILFFFVADVVGKSGRDVIQKWIPILRKKLHLDFAIVNGKNTAHMAMALLNKFVTIFIKQVWMSLQRVTMWDQRSCPYL